MNIQEFGKRRAMHNYIDSDVRAFAEMQDMDSNETWELRVTTLARMLARTLNERESNSSEFEIVIAPNDAWNERLISLIDERCRTMSTEEFLEEVDE